MSRISRRTATRLLVTAPAAMPAIATLTAQESPPKPSAFAACIAASEIGLSGDEHARLEKALGTLEQSLKTIREFKLPLDADPAMHFAPMKSPRRRNG